MGMTVCDELFLKMEVICLLEMHIMSKFLCLAWQQKITAFYFKMKSMFQIIKCKCLWKHLTFEFRKFLWFFMWKEKLSSCRGKDKREEYLFVLYVFSKYVYRLESCKKSLKWIGQQMTQNLSKFSSADTQVFYFPQIFILLVPVVLIWNQLSLFVVKILR